MTTSPILRKDLFPLHCTNPECLQSHDENQFIAQINRYGVAYVDGGGLVFQGFTCANCGQTILWSFPRYEPLVDLRNFMMIPSTTSTRLNCFEQLIEKSHENDAYDTLKFRYIPAWDHSKVSIGEIANFFKSNSAIESVFDVSYFRVYPEFPNVKISNQGS